MAVAPVGVLELSQALLLYQLLLLLLLKVLLQALCQLLWRHVLVRDALGVVMHTYVGILSTVIPLAWQVPWEASTACTMFVPNAPGSPPTVSCQTCQRVRVRVRVGVGVGHVADVKQRRTLLVDVLVEAMPRLHLLLRLLRLHTSRLKTAVAVHKTLVRVHKLPARKVCNRSGHTESKSVPATGTARARG